MRIHNVLLASVLMLSSAAVACDEPHVGVMSAHDEGKGTTRDYYASFDDAWKAAHAVLSWDGAGTPEDHLDQQYVITNHPSSPAPSFGDEVGMWFYPESPDRTRVRVIVIQRGLADATHGGPDEQTFHEDLKKALAMLHDGKPLPEKRP